MFEHLLRNALRNIGKGRAFSIINILGLAMGLCACLLITLFVADEFSYDRYNDKADRIFRIVYDAHLNGNAFIGNYAPFPMGPTLVKENPPIENAVRIRSQGDVMVKTASGDELETRVVFADSSLFSVFTLPMIAGDPVKALARPHTIVISETIAKKYFNSTAVLGKTLAMYGNITSGTTDTPRIYQITGVMKDMPAASHFHFDIIKSMAEKYSNSWHWGNPHSATYILARPGVTITDINRILAATVAKYVTPDLKQQANGSLKEMTEHGDYFREYCIPLVNIHLYSNVLGEFESNGSIATVRIFMVIAILVLLIACMNFMNLATARSADHSREVGVRKVLGASRSELIAGFLFESVLTTMIAGAMAFLLAVLLLSWFDHLSGKNFQIGVLGKRWIVVAFLLGPVSVGLLAGSYPAFYLSAFKPIQILRGRLAMGFTNSGFRRGLVVFQFTISIALIIATLVIYNQLDYIRHRDLGYNRDQVLTIFNTNSLGEQAKVFQQEAQQLPGVTGSTMTGYLPNRVHDGSITYYKDASANVTKAFLLQRWYIDAQYIPLLGMKLLGGRNFSPDLTTDSSGVLINETAARLLGYPDPVGKPLYRGSDSADTYHILGLVKDFNAGTLHEKIQPIVFHLKDDRHAVSFRIHTDNIPALIATLGQRYRSLDGSAGHPFIYSFMDDDFNHQYESDQRTGRIFISFSIFAIFIACLGLFGLITYAAEVRTKEIGIRKVLGASVNQIVGLLSADFFKLVLLAAAIACPVAGWLMHNWLQGFAYRTTMGWWVFLLAVVLAGVITLVTVCLRSVRAAMVNPVVSLRGDN